MPGYINGRRVAARPRPATGDGEAHLLSDAAADRNTE